jgi:hypothetical protein
VRISGKPGGVLPLIGFFMARLLCGTSVPINLAVSQRSRSNYCQKQKSASQRIVLPRKSQIPVNNTHSKILSNSTLSFETGKLFLMVSRYFSADLFYVMRGSCKMIVIPESLYRGSSLFSQSLFK